MYKFNNITNNVTYNVTYDIIRQHNITYIHKYIVLCLAMAWIVSSGFTLHQSRTRPRVRLQDQEHPSTVPFDLHAIGKRCA